MYVSLFESSVLVLEFGFELSVRVRVSVGGHIILIKRGTKNEEQANSTTHNGNCIEITFLSVCLDGGYLSREYIAIRSPLHSSTMELDDNFKCFCVRTDTRAPPTHSPGGHLEIYWG